MTYLCFDYSCVSSDFLAFCSIFTQVAVIVDVKLKFELRIEYRAAHLTRRLFLTTFPREAIIFLVFSKIWTAWIWYPLYVCISLIFIYPIVLKTKSQLQNCWTSSAEMTERAWSDLILIMVSSCSHSPVLELNSKIWSRKPLILLYPPETTLWYQ